MKGGRDMKRQTIIKKPPSPEAIEKVHQFIAERRQMIVSRILEAKGREEASRRQDASTKSETA